MGAVDHKRETLKISIRTFTPEDLAQVQKLFIESRIYGAGSPLRLALRKYMLTPTAYTFYSLFFLGTCLRQRNPTAGLFRYTGTALVASSVLFFVGMAFPIGMFAFFGFRALYRGDMKDVATHYRLRESQRGEAGASSFWVAEVESSGSRKIVGCIGLDCFSNGDPTEGELRRMFVTPGFRGHGVAKKLMSALLDHARSCGLKYVYLNTTGLNDKAVIMYNNTGWELVKKHVFQAGFLRGEGYDFRMKLVEEKEK